MNLCTPARRSPACSAARPVAYALHTAGHPAYRTALEKLDHSIATLIRIRLDAAHRRIEDGKPTRASKYDLINGLTGLGTYLLHRYDGHELLRDVLAYLVRLTQPVRDGSELLPGWWATGSPDRRASPRWEGSHAGFGMAHGVCGPLAQLSAAMRRGVIVSGQSEAIHTIGAWLDRWRHGQDRRAWWPEVITARRAAVDATTGDLANAADVLSERLRHHPRDPGALIDDGLLEGATGIAIVKTTPRVTAPPAWDTCPLVT